MPTKFLLHALRLAAASAVLAAMPAFAFYDGAMQYAYHDLLALSPAPTTDQFGAAVAVSGDRLAVADLNACPAPVTDAGCGSVDVYARSGGRWVFEARLAEAMPQPGDYFGSAVAIDGDWLIVGANGENGSGNVHLYQRTVSGSVATWTPVPLDTSGLPPGELGAAVAISSAGLAVAGLPYRTRGGGSADGAVVTFVRDTASGTWSTEALLEGNGEFGYSIGLYTYRLLGAVNGHAIAVGAVDDNGGTGEGYVYTRGVHDSGWTLGASYDLGTTDKVGFGFSAAISGGTAVFGLPDRIVGGKESGSIYVVHRNSTSWTDVLSYEITSPDTTTSHQFFGGKVATDGNTIFVGAANTQVVYQFDYVDGLSGKYWALNFDSPIAAPTGIVAAGVGRAIAFDGASLVIGNSASSVPANGDVLTYLQDLMFTDGFEGN